MTMDEKREMWIACCKICLLAENMKCCKLCKFNIGLEVIKFEENKEVKNVS